MLAISFVIPCYNAETFILKNIIQLKKKILSLKVAYEIILVDDGSDDNTPNILKDITKKNKSINLIINKKNTGKSYSVLKGIKKSKYQHIIMIDCDLPYFQSLSKIVFYLKKNIDLVIVNRKLKESKLKKKQLNIYQLTR